MKKRQTQQPTRDNGNEQPNNEQATNDEQTMNKK